MVWVNTLGIVASVAHTEIARVANSYMIGYSGSDLHPAIVPESTVAARLAVTHPGPAFFRASSVDFLQEPDHGFSFEWSHP